VGEGGEHGLTVVSYFGRVWLSVLHSERWLVFVVFMGVFGVSGDRVEAISTQSSILRTATQLRYIRSRI